MNINIHNTDIVDKIDEKLGPAPIITGTVTSIVGGAIGIFGGYEIASSINEYLEITEFAGKMTLYSAAISTGIASGYTAGFITGLAVASTITGITKAARKIYEEISPNK